jgi:8-amino-7-oxononanoate synthase
MASRLACYETMLQQLDRQGRWRALTRQSGLDFTSNDYLGLAESRCLNVGLISAIERGVPAGTGGSRLLRGNHPEHEALEAEAACFFHSERMLYFGSGYAANLAMLSTLPLRGDLIVHDVLVHTSTHAGIAAGRAEAVAVTHNDVEAFDDAIRTWRKGGGKGQVWIAVESLYSMDGDRAPLRGLAELADRRDGFFVTDEAHSTGVHGADGRGLAADLEGRENVIVLHTCGKALGMSGVLAGGGRVLCDFLINRARPFIYATAPSPLQAVGVRLALKTMADQPERRERLYDLIAFANAKAAELLDIEGAARRSCRSSSVITAARNALRRACKPAVSTFVRSELPQYQSARRVCGSRSRSTPMLQRLSKCSNDWHKS